MNSMAPVWCLHNIWTALDTMSRDYESEFYCCYESDSLLDVLNTWLPASRQGPQATPPSFDRHEHAFRVCVALTSKASCDLNESTSAWMFSECYLLSWGDTALKAQEGKEALCEPETWPFLTEHWAIYVLSSLARSLSFYLLTEKGQRQFSRHRMYTKRKDSHWGSSRLAQWVWVKAPAVEGSVWWWTELDPWDPRGRRRKPAPADGPRTRCALWGLCTGTRPLLSNQSINK